MMRIGHSIEDRLYKGQWGMQEHVELLTEQQMPTLPVNHKPAVTIRNANALPVA